MVCKGCDKKLKGGFQQDDGKFLCARCVCIKVERECDRSAMEKIIELCNLAINQRNRPTKKQLREIRRWAKAILKFRVIRDDL